MSLKTVWVYETTEDNFSLKFLYKLVWIIEASRDNFNQKLDIICLILAGFEESFMTLANTF